MKRWAYAMVIEPGRDKHGRRYFSAYFPDLPGCATMGRNRKHLPLMAKEAVEGHLKVTGEFGEPAPAPSSLVAMVTVSAPSESPAKPNTAQSGKSRRAAAGKNGSGRQLTVRGKPVRGRR